MTPSFTTPTVSDKLFCVVTDDDAVSRQTLENHIATTPGLVLAGSFADGIQLLEFLRTRPAVDLLFLDVQMPGLSGLDVIRQLPTAPAVVLTTAHASFAVEAFELRVADYVVKPVGYARFSQAVERVRNRRPAAAPTAEAAKLLPGALLPAGRESALFVKSGSRMVRLAIDDILYVEAVNDQTVVVTLTRQISANQMLRDVASRLPEGQFMRVHRSFVVNRRRIDAVEDATLLMEGGRVVPIGRTYLTDVLASLPTT